MSQTNRTDWRQVRLRDEWKPARSLRNKFIFMIITADFLRVGVSDFYHLFSEGVKCNKDGLYAKMGLFIWTTKL